MLDFLNREFPEVKEAYRLTNLFEDAICCNFDEEQLWSEIVADVAEANRLRNYPEYSDLPPEAPFIQGDKPNTTQRLPDVIYLGEDFVLGIECFVFDSSKKTRDGSTMRRKNVFAEKKLDDLSHTTLPPYKLSASVDVQLSYANYVDSLLNVFRKHAKNIGVYREALEKEHPGKRVYLAFYIEDVTQIGNYIKSGNQTVAMNPVFVKEFITELLAQKGLDYVISCYQELYVPYLYLQKVDDIALMDNLKNCYTNTDSFYQYQYVIQSITH